MTNQHGDFVWCELMVPDADAARKQVLAAMATMKKIDIAAIKPAQKG
ncbi:MAG: hypothetical protein KGZ65_03385 [Sphingomonadales bacterium]|nr:hypothetical protein [Sphingomonadaceae bacterium]MBS3930252.1 hypothetical protein [Sphingomonadales bacterium]MBX9643912.1 hypothetical protein [Novosphingobium sp.]